jgi:hypothetical protein
MMCGFLLVEMGWVSFTAVRVEEVDLYDVTHADRYRHSCGKNEENTCGLVTGRKSSRPRIEDAVKSIRTEILGLTLRLPQNG